MPWPRIIAPRVRKANTSQNGQPLRKSGTALPLGALGAQPEHVEGVLQVGEPVLGRHLLGPGLHDATADLHRGAALAAHQVVVVLDRKSTRLNSSHVAI